MTDKVPVIKFDVTRRVVNREYIAAEGSNSAMTLLMSEFAVDDNGEKIIQDDFIEAIGDYDDVELFRLWMQFRAAAVPKVTGRR